jgi:DNA-binding response OmpR family regulator
MEPASREVYVDGQPVTLSAREFALLELLMRRPGRPLSRAQIEEQLLGWGEEVCSNAVEVQVHHLRRKIGAGRIHNIRGVGYFVPKS